MAEGPLKRLWMGYSASSPIKLIHTIGEIFFKNVKNAFFFKNKKIRKIVSHGFMTKGHPDIRPLTGPLHALFVNGKGCIN